MKNESEQDEIWKTNEEADVRCILVQITKKGNLASKQEFS